MVGNIARINNIGDWLGRSTAYPVCFVSQLPEQIKEDVRIKEYKINFMFVF